MTNYPAASIIKLLKSFVTRTPISSNQNAVFIKYNTLIGGSFSSSTLRQKFDDHKASFGCTAIYLSQEHDLSFRCRTKYSLDVCGSLVQITVIYRSDRLGTVHYRLNIHIFQAFTNTNLYTNKMHHLITYFNTHFDNFSSISKIYIYMSQDFKGCIDCV